MAHVDNEVVPVLKGNLVDCLLGVTTGRSVVAAGNRGQQRGQVGPLQRAQATSSRCIVRMKCLQEPDAVSGSTADNATAGAQECRPHRVLVVDDERLTRWSVVEILAEQGYEVTEASDAASAIDAFQGSVNDADVVLLDLWLPDSNDLRVLSAIRRRSPSTPIIVMTAYGSPELSEAARRLGAFAVMDKPFEMDALAPLVGRAITSGSQSGRTPIEAPWHGGQR